MIPKITLTIFGFIAAILLAELVSLGYIGALHGVMFYRMPLDSSRISTGTEQAGLQPLFKIHPYFGFVYKDEVTVRKVVLPDRIKHMTSEYMPLPEWVDIGPNNHGFWSDTHYPITTQNDNEFIVGILGGSVAQWVSVQAGEHLKNALEKLPMVSGKRVRLMNLAIGGYKQPQQVLVLSYFMALGQKFDLVVNIDGFNEVALPYAENFPKHLHYSLPRSYPSSLSAVSTMAGAEMLDWLYHGQQLKRSIRYWSQFDEQRSSALLYLIANRLVVLYRKNLQKHAMKIPEISTEEENAFFTLKDNWDAVNSTRETGMVDMWVDSSLLMNDMAMANGAIYVHILQPNQYYSKKKFSNIELAIAYDHDHPYADPVRKFYPELIESAQKLLDAGVLFVDASTIFDRVDDVIYSDSCCHYNDLGNTILANEIVSAIRRRVTTHVTEKSAIARRDN